MYVGRQPARTALIATFSTVTVRRRVGSRTTTSSGSRPAASTKRRTASSVAGTTGRPSAQPRSKHVSTASSQPGTSTWADVSRMPAPPPFASRPAPNTMRPGRVSSRAARS